MDNLQSSEELSSLQPIVTSESSIQSNQPCDKADEENLQDIIGILVCQMNRMKILSLLFGNFKLTSRLGHLILKKLAP